MCGCDKTTEYVPPHPEPWKLVSASLLQMFLGAVQCRVVKKVYDDYLTEVEIGNLQTLLLNYIEAKLSDPETQLYYDQMPYIQERMDYIYTKQICL